MSSSVVTMKTRVRLVPSESALSALHDKINHALQCAPFVFRSGQHYSALKKRKARRSSRKRFIPFSQVAHIIVAHLRNNAYCGIHFETPRVDLDQWIYLVIYFPKLWLSRVTRLASTIVPWTSSYIKRLRIICVCDFLYKADDLIASLCIKCRKRFMISFVLILPIVLIRFNWRFSNRQARSLYLILPCQHFTYMIQAKSTVKFKAWQVAFLHHSTLLFPH